METTATPESTAGGSINTEQFIRESVARGLSRRATIQAPGLGRRELDLIIGAMGSIEWAKNGTMLDNHLTYEASRGRFTPVQAAALERAHERRNESRRFTVDGMTGTIAGLMEHFQSPVHTTTVRRRAAADMSPRDALITPRQQPKPGRRDPQKRPRQ